MTTPLDAASCFPVFCFGKLPAFGDFVRHNAGGRDVLAFDQWLQQGLYHARTELRSDWEASYESAPTYQFLFFPENSESYLIGVLQPSHDRSERCYPFIVSLRVDRRFPSRLLPLAPVLFASFLEGAMQLAHAAGQGMTLPEIAEATDRLQTPVLRDYQTLATSYANHLTTTRTDRLRERLWGSAGEERVLLVFKNLLEVLLPLRGRNAARLAPGLRFPIPAEAPDLSFTASFWLDAAFRLMGVTDSRPSIFWTAPRHMPNDGDSANPSDGNGVHATAAHLFLFLRRPSVRSVLYFLRPDLNSDSICEVDVDGLDQIAKAGAGLPPQFVTILSTRETSLRQLLGTLANPRVYPSALREATC